MTDRDIEIAKSYIYGSTIPSTFGTNDNGDFMEDPYSLIDGDDYTIEYGATKMVVVPNEEDFVIKVPFNGYWIEDYEYDDDGYEVESEQSFVVFDGAHSPYHDDYCYAEMMATRSMEENGYGMLAPKIKFVEEYNGRPFYIQERVIPYYRGVDRFPSSRENKEKAKSLKSAFPSEWLGRVFDMYGEDFWNGFIDWVENQTTGIILNDVHSGNVGYTYEGAPVMFDLSGYDS